MADYQETARTLMRAALNGAIDLRSKEAGFVGQMAFATEPPSEKQARWLGIIADKNGLGGEKADG